MRVLRTFRMRAFRHAGGRDAQGVRELESCGIEFEAKREDARFHSAVCRAKASRERRETGGPDPGPSEANVRGRLFLGKFPGELHQAEQRTDGPVGIVSRKDGGQLRGPLRVTYRAGRLIVAENISGAARIILQHLWATQRPTRGGGLPGARDDFSVTEPIPGLGYAIPNRAVQLLNPDDQGPGLA